METLPALKFAAVEPRSFSDLPQHLQLAILTETKPPFKVADRLRQRRVSREMRDVIDTSCYYTIWSHTDFSPSADDPPISRATFRGVINYLCDCAKRIDGQSGGAGGALSAANSWGQQRDPQRHVSARGAVTVGSSQQPRQLVGRFVEQISSAQNAPPISFDGKPEMVLNVSGLQTTLWFDDLFEATGALSEFWALTLIANGWEGKIGMYSLSHFLYRRVKSAQAECLVIERERDWEPVLERVRGIGAAMSRLTVLSLRTGERCPVDRPRAVQLGEALRRSQTIKAVAIESLDAQSPAVLDPILKGLAGIPTLERLRLCHVTAPPDTRFRANAPPPVALGAFVPFLADAPETLTQLELSGLHLGQPWVLDSLVEGLAKSQTLKEVKFPSFVGAEKVPLRTIVRLLEPNLGLECLDIQTAHLTPNATCLLAAYLALNPILLTLSVTLTLCDSVPLLLLSAGLKKNTRLRRLNLGVCFRAGATREGYAALKALVEGHGDRVQLSCCSLQVSFRAECPQYAGFSPLCRPPGVLSLARLQSFDVARRVPPGRPVLEQLVALRDDWNSQRLEREIESSMDASHRASPGAKRKRATVEGRFRRPRAFVEVFELLKDGCPELEKLMLQKRPVWAACESEALVLRLRVV